MGEVAERQTVADFAREHCVTLSVEPWHENPYMPDSDDMYHWRCRLWCERRSVQFVFSMGQGCGGKAPGLVEVLDCLASDASLLENAPTFEQWADELGYDADSRTAERCFKATCDQSGALRRVLGGDAFEALLWNVERE